jgi:O-antigen ligase
MNNDLLKEPVWLNRAIEFFIILFLASLTNSIFINQIGYYGALLLTIGKFFYIKENRFFKTGIELPIILFFIAELISTILSQNQPQSIEHMFKRMILLPVIYVIAANAVDIKKVKLYFTVYIVFAVISAVIYNYFSYEYFVKGLFQIKKSGSDFFHYPITTSELLSFSAVFLFAFLINEKNNWRQKILTIIAFGTTIIALLATYKRTGWIGFAAGIVFILIMKKMYKTISVLASCIIVIFFFQNDESRIYSINYTENKLAEISEYQGEGIAKNLLFDNNHLLISDFDNGLLTYKNSKITKELDTPFPIESLKKLDSSSYIASLIDTRFLLLEYSNEFGYKIKDEFFTKGMTGDYDISDGILYVIDTDSGLTIFPEPSNPNKFFNYSGLTGFTNLAVEDSLIVLYSQTKGMQIVKHRNGLPYDIENSFKITNRINFVAFVKEQIIFSDEQGIALLKPYQTSIKYFKTNFDYENIYSCSFKDGKLFFATYSGEVKEIKLPFHDELEIINSYELGFIPRSIEFGNDQLFVSKIKTSRLLSIFDPHQPSNFSRIAMWTTGLKIFMDYPIFGIGDISVENFYRQYKKSYYKEIHGHLHNSYIHLLVILGGFGFFAVMFLLIKILVLDIKIINSVRDKPFLSSYALGAGGCLISFLTAGLTEWNFGDHEIITLVWFITGLNFAVYRISKLQLK